jgi:hypothetical protein
MAGGKGQDGAGDDPSRGEYPLSAEIQKIEGGRINIRKDEEAKIRLNPNLCLLYLSSSLPYWREKRLTGFTGRR